LKNILLSLETNFRGDSTANQQNHPAAGACHRITDFCIHEFLSIKENEPRAAVLNPMLTIMALVKHANKQ